MKRLIILCASVVFLALRLCRKTTNGYTTNDVRCGWYSGSSYRTGYGGDPYVLHCKNQNC